MRFACHGFISDAAGSGAGAFAVLLRTLLEQGHAVTFYGLPRFTEPKALTAFPRYRFVPMDLPTFKPWRKLARALPVQYPFALLGLVGHIANQREAIRLIEAEPPDEAPDCVLCLDALNFWSSRLPVLSWPQAPPQTEWAALREPVIALAVARAMGPFYLAAVNAFYAYRYVQARLSLETSDVLLISSRWAERNWLAFGLPPERAALIPYPIELEPSAEDEERTRDGTTTFLWLGRAAPRKRLDLFLEAFARLRQRHSNVQALLVGKVATDPTAARLLAQYRDVPGITVEAPVPRAEVARIFARADVLVQPSQNENFGFAVAEALAAGLPVVVGPANGTADYAGAAAFAFDRYEPSSLLAALERVRDAVNRDRLGLSTEARRNARQSFDRHRVAERVVELSRSALERRARRATTAVR
jgi:glycosyltransferase involved in cell wall biosynthesis